MTNDEKLKDEISELKIELENKKTKFNEYKLLVGLISLAVVVFFGEYFLKEAGIGREIRLLLGLSFVIGWLYWMKISLK